MTATRAEIEKIVGFVHGKSDREYSYLVDAICAAIGPAYEGLTARELIEKRSEINREIDTALFDLVDEKSATLSSVSDSERSSNTKQGRGG